MQSNETIQHQPLEKGLDILELFASTPGGLTVSEAARMLKRTVSEIFRMLLCLERRGYLSQSENREKYRLTLKLFRLAQEHPPTKRLVTESLPVMHQVAHSLRQSCHLGLIDGGHVVILAQVDSPESTGLYVKMGAKVNLMHAATGHVILAHQTDDARRRALEEWSLERRSGRSRRRTSTPTLRKSIAEAMKDGPATRLPASSTSASPYSEQMEKLSRGLRFHMSNE